VEKSLLKKKKKFKPARCEHIALDSTILPFYSTALIFYYEYVLMMFTDTDIEVRYHRTVLNYFLFEMICRWFPPQKDRTPQCALTRLRYEGCTTFMTRQTFQNQHLRYIPHVYLDNSSSSSVTSFLVTTHVLCSFLILFIRSVVPCKWIVTVCICTAKVDISPRFIIILVLIDFCWYNTLHFLYKCWATPWSDDG
jgi:hypothetical protein